MSNPTLQHDQPSLVPVAPPGDHPSVGAFRLPSISLPRAGERHLFWTSVALRGDNRPPSLSQQVETVRANIATLKEHLDDLAQAPLQEPAELQTMHTALTVLMDRARREADRLQRILVDIQLDKGRVLAVWRVTEREINATEAAQLRETLRCVLAEIRRFQVDLSGRLLEQA